MQSLNPRITVWHSMAEAAPAWRDLERRGELYATQSFAWLQHWQQRVGDNAGVKPCIVAIAEPHAPQMLLPLALEPSGTTTVLRWLGGDITDYGAPVLDREFAEQLHPDRFPELWEAIREQLPAHDAIDFENQPTHVGAAPNPFMQLEPRQSDEINFHAQLETDWDSFYAKLVRSQLRGDTRRKARRLTELGALRYEVATNAAEIGAISQAMIEQKTERYVDTDTYSLFNNEHYKPFFLEPSQELLDSGLLHVSALRLDDQILATHWGLVHRGRLYYLMASFGGGELMRHSPGRVLLQHLLRWAVEHQLDVFDFTIGDEPFKKDWSNRSGQLFRHLRAITTRGKLYTTLEMAKDGVRRRPGLHRWISRMRNRRGAE